MLLNLLTVLEGNLFLLLQDFDDMKVLLWMSYLNLGDGSRENFLWILRATLAKYNKSKVGDRDSISSRSIEDCRIKRYGPSPGLPSGR